MLPAASPAASCWRCVYAGGPRNDRVARSQRASQQWAEHLLHLLPQLLLHLHSELTALVDPNTREQFPGPLAPPEVGTIVRERERERDQVGFQSA